MTAAAAPARNKRGIETRKRVLDAATRCFERDGLEITLDQVAQEAGTTRMTVHRHTGGREALLRHVVLRSSAGLVDHIAAELDKDGVPFARRVTAAMGVVIAIIRDTPYLLALFAQPSTSWSAVDPDDQVVGTVRSFLRPYFDTAHANGELREDPAASLEWVLHQLLLYLAVPDVADQAQLEEELRRFVAPALSI